MSTTHEADDRSASDEKSFFKDVEKIVEQKFPDFGKTLNIAIIGKVSAGKSSILNALLRRTRESLLSGVGAKSGVTDKLHFFQLDDRVLIVDSPGLDDIKREKSQITEQFLRSIDVGLLLVTGSADASQKRHYDDLKRLSKKAIVVLNKIDEWDHLKACALQAVEKQWKAALNVDTIYLTCAKGFDPDSKPDTPSDVRGIDCLREAIENFLRAEGKDLLLARHMGDKMPYAIAIIVPALLAVAGEAFIPGSALYITATQAVAIVSLYYLYTGKILSKSSALGLLPTFMGETIGYNLFLWLKSFLPPTGILDAVAAAIAFVITFAMLVTVNQILAGGYEIYERDRLAKVFGEIRRKTESTIRNATLKDWTSANFWKRLIMQVMYS